MRSVLAGSPEGVTDRSGGFWKSTGRRGSSEIEPPGTKNLSTRRSAGSHPQDLRRPMGRRRKGWGICSVKSLDTTLDKLEELKKSTTFLSP